MYITDLKQEDIPHYVSDADMIRFISKNAPMDWNKCCDFVREHNICGEEGPIYWTKDILVKPELYNEEQIKWIGAFFEAYPFIEKFMLVFDD